MLPKTLITALTDPEQASLHLEAAARIAASEDAHLDVLAFGVDHTQVSLLYAGDAPTIVQASMDRARQLARETAAAARSVLQSQPGLRWTVEPVIVPLANVAETFGMLAKFADLCVLPRPYGSDFDDEYEALVEGALFDGMGRVLILPGKSLISRPKRVTLAWNDSPEALAAVRAALPYLREAELVKLVIVDPPAHSRDRSDPGGQLAEYLVRHGVHVEIDVLTRSLPRVSDVIRRHADDIGADMIVMGAYGHSRFREAILGGATRHMLEEAQLPVFMTHA